jgi:hypothetical protein
MKDGSYKHMPEPSRDASEDNQGCEVWVYMNNPEIMQKSS